MGEMNGRANGYVHVNGRRAERVPEEPSPLETPLTFAGWRGSRDARAAERVTKEIEWGIARATRERALAREAYSQFYHEQRERALDRFDLDAADFEREQMVELQGRAMTQLAQSLDHIMSKRWQ